MLAPAQTNRESSGKAISPQQPASQIFSGLGRRLNGADSARRAAEIVLEAADAMLGWDAASLDLHSPESDTANCVLAMDLVEGRRTEVALAKPDTKPSPKMREVISAGAQLLERGAAPQFGPELTPFGDSSRPSASLTTKKRCDIIKLAEDVRQSPYDELDVLLSLKDPVTQNNCPALVAFPPVEIESPGVYSKRDFHYPVFLDSQFPDAGGNMICHYGHEVGFLQDFLNKMSMQQCFLRVCKQVASPYRNNQRSVLRQHA